MDNERKRFKTIVGLAMSNRVPASDNEIAVKLARFHEDFAGWENSNYSPSTKETYKQEVAKKVGDLLAAHDREVAAHARWIEAGRPDLP